MSTVVNLEQTQEDRVAIVSERVYQMLFEQGAVDDLSKEDALTLITPAVAYSLRPHQDRGALRDTSLKHGESSPGPSGSHQGCLQV